MSVAKVGGKTKLKLEIATTSVPPTESSSTSSPTGRRHRRRGPPARARHNQRAATHQAAVAEAVTSAPSCALEDPPARPPLQLLPSPPADSGRRKVISVEKLDVPTFSFINIDGSSSPPPSSPTPSLSPTTPTPTPFHADQLSATSTTTTLTASTVADVCNCAVSTMAAIVASRGSMMIVTSVTVIPQ